MIYYISFSFVRIISFVLHPNTPVIENIMYTRQLCNTKFLILYKTYAKDNTSYILLTMF